MLECVINVSEGRDRTVVWTIAEAAGRCLLDVHTDAGHNRSVLTLGGRPEAVEAAARAVTADGVTRIDLRRHTGAHPRLGAVDVVPFVPLGESTSIDVAVEARDRFVAWASSELAVPCFVYGPERTLPEIRRTAFVTLAPDAGPPEPHPTAGAICAGARPILIAYNLWLPPGTSLVVARRIAAAIRSPQVRSLGFGTAEGVQVSCNLVAPYEVGPADVYDAVAARTPIERAELVGLLPVDVLDAIPAERWPQLDLSRRRTIEARLVRDP